MRVAAMVASANGGRDVVSRAIRAGGAEPSWVRGAGDLPRVVSGEKTARAVLIDVAAKPASEIVAWLREDVALHGMPIVGLVPSATDDAFRTAHALGADDAVVLHDGDAIARRIRRLAWFDPALRAPVTRGYALVVHPDQHRRRVIGRVLRQARFDPLFASTEDEAFVLAHGLRDIGIAVVGAGMSASSLLARLDLPGLPCVQQTANAVAPSARGKTVTLLEVAPADDLLFVVNELCAERGRDARASRRVLLGTLCSFRSPGVIAPSIGLTYNLSREGLYVRTLDPPETGSEQWIELRPPWRRPVHLRGRVAWSRGPEAWDRGAPAGFGIRIDDTASAALDLAEYRAGYAELCAAGEPHDRPTAARDTATASRSDLGSLEGDVR